MQFDLVLRLRVEGPETVVSTVVSPCAQSITVPIAPPPSFITSDEPARSLRDWDRLARAYRYGRSRISDLLGHAPTDDDFDHLVTALDRAFSFERRSSSAEGDTTMASGT